MEYLSCMTMGQKQRRSRYLLVLSAFFFALVGCSYAHTSNKTYDEGTVRAVVIYKIMRFTEWTSHSGENLNLCGFGSGNSLERLSILNGKRINKFTLRILPKKQQPKGQNCHVIILGKQTQPPKQQTFQHPESHLVVCDGCTQHKPLASVELITLKNNIGFNINLNAAKRSKVEISSDLLVMANEVRGKNE